MKYSKYIKIHKKTDENIYICPGYSLIVGTSYLIHGINFNVMSKYGETLTLLIYKKGSKTPTYEIEFPKSFKVGDLFNMFVGGIDWSLYEYVFKMTGPYNEAEGLLFDDKNMLLDPHASKLSGMEEWGKKREYLRCQSVPVDFSEGMVSKPHIPTDDLVIYEMHVRGFSVSDPTSSAPGTFKGLEEKIPYLLDLGVNCVELMPIFEFDELQNTNLDPKTGDALKNYWGYQTISFYAPKAGYAKGDVIDELRHLINELHKNKIEVFLDVVFNHTGEMGYDGPSLSFRGLDNKTYYMLDEKGEPYNYTGCGNTFNCNNPLVREFILDSLRYWRSQYFIDGFRFDLASVMTRDEKGNVLSNPPLVEQITTDPILADCKLIAEPWDASGLYQLGNFYSDPRWMEWNGKFRDTVRSFLRGDDNVIEELLQRIGGSHDLYGEATSSSVNFVCCHDGFTLYDLFSYNEKHNENNGEENRDGNDYNLSFNCGVEGDAEDSEILALRKKLIKIALVILFTSKGVPMILMGDECMRTQKGNNNAWCQDNEISWFDWTLPNRNKDILDWTKSLIKFRKDNKELFSAKDNIKFHGVNLNAPDTSQTSHTLAYTYELGNKIIYVGLNLYSEPLTFNLPERNWKVVFSTDDNMCLKDKVLINPQSVVVLSSEAQ